MATVASFKTELESMQSLMRRQSSIILPTDMNTMLIAQCGAFTAKAQTIVGMTIDSVSMLTEVVQAGTWTHEQKSKIITALNAALSGGSAVVSSKKTRRSSQEILSFQNYCIQDDADAFTSDGIPFNTKIKIAVLMMKRMGLILASEQSKAHIMKVLMAACPEYLATLDYESARAKMALADS